MLKIGFERFFLTILFMGSSLCESITFSQAGIISDRLKNDQIYQDLNDSDITSYLSSLNSDGSWNDIDYSNRSAANWIPSNHSRRLLLICRAYNKPESICFKKASVRSKIVKIIDFYIERRPESSNWWWNAIGAPTNLGPALLLMKSDDSTGIEQTQLAKYADMLLNYYSESAVKWPGATTGANKIWLLTSSIYKACINNNESVLKENFHSAFEEAAIMPGKNEGIKIDGSFHQHSTQLYCGGYGMSFMSDITNFAKLASGTRYQMNDEQVKVLTDVLLDGYRWFIQKSAFDFSSIGREIARPGAGSSLALRNYITRLISINAPRSDELSEFVNFISGASPFRDPGNKHFWKSDIMVQHGPEFYLSARVPSVRTIGSERMNNENLKRKWLPWGATNIMTGGDEYRNIYPVWDWSRIPGVTSYLEHVSGRPETGGAFIVSETSFAGGVSDGTYGMAAYDYSWEGISGKKAWFFTPEGMICLGAGIEVSKGDPVITSVNQCYSKGDVTVEMKKRKNTGGTQVFNSHSPGWIHHNGIGYFFPSGGTISLKDTLQSGSWNDINQSQSKAPVTYKVFSIWIDHGTYPSGSGYEYIVVPSATPEKFHAWIKERSMVTIMNTPDIQSAGDVINNISGIAFYSPGTVSLTNGLKIEALNPCLLLVRVTDDGFKITASDPTAMLEKIMIRINREVTGPGASENPDKSTAISFLLPSGDEAGMSVSQVFQVNITK